MASKFEIEVEPTRSGPRVRIYDVDQERHTSWVCLRAAWRDAPDEVAFAAALRQSHLLDEAVDTAKSIAYAVYLNEVDFDIQQVDQEWIANTVAGWQRDRLSAETTDPDRTTVKPKI